MKEENLIFLISQPRAGSTYLQNLLSNNNETNTCSEPWLLLYFANQFKPNLFEAKFDNKLAKTAFNDYLEKYPSINFNNEQKSFLLNLYTPLFDGYKFAIDKTPRYWEIMDEIQNLFPNSKIIILKRNPLDVVKSIINTWNINSISELNYYKRDLLLAPKKIHAFCKNHRDNPNIYALRYEDLIRDTIVEIKKVYKWIGIAYQVEVSDTSNNQKYKGKFGDPYQNSEKSYYQVKTEFKQKTLNKTFKDFLIGYENYLGSEFLLAYGNYELTEAKQKQTRAYNYFMHIRTDGRKRIHLKKEFSYLLKEIFYRLFK
ncbi:sulfotransferase [Winogradskyella sp. F6397]|uniref:Sulfotransferase n=1 Tax=Winogradskyella marina TaxID=2785530 RepID=A0ABS0ELG9_9FLAO|nr:sulfotransferase [Winogradskyella marina]MBF8150976.1 sulfotransferase [Winogradskyella marina]